MVIANRIRLVATFSQKNETQHGTCLFSLNCILFACGCVSLFTMFSVAVVGHSLTPTNVSVAGANISIFRKPGGKWGDLNSDYFRGFWDNQFDFVIFVLGIIGANV